MGKTTRVMATALFLALICSAEGRAQEWLWGAEYMISGSTSDTKSFVNDFSFRNVAIEGRNMLQPNVSAGLLLGWNVFAEQTDQLISFANAEVSGVQYRYVNAFPIMATAHYYFGGRRNSIRPYVGGGAGTFYAENRLEIGLVAFTTNHWHLGVAPEAGIIIPVNYNARALLNVRYNYGFEAGGMKLSYWTVGVGIGWM